MLRAKKQYTARASEHRNSVDSYHLSGRIALEVLPPVQATLRTIDVSGCIRLVDIRAFEHATSLVVLHMRACVSVKDLSSLSGLRDLEELDVRGCVSLQGSVALMELPRLRKVRCAGASGNWTRYSGEEEDDLAPALCFFSPDSRRWVVQDTLRRLSPLMVPNNACFLWYVEGMVNLLADVTEDMSAGKIDTLSSAKQTLCFLAAATFFCIKCACIYGPSVRDVAGQFGFSDPDLVLVAEGEMINRTSLDVLAVTGYATHLEWAACVWGLVDETEERAAREGRPLLDRLARVQGPGHAPLVLALASLPSALLERPVVRTLFEKDEVGEAIALRSLAA
jgi:hypothetical protein